MGVSIEGDGTSTIRIEAPARCKGATHRLDGDYIEAGSWGVVAAITGGEIEVTGARRTDLESIDRAAHEDGRSSARSRTTSASSSSRRRLVAARRITTGLWPGFPSDIVSLVTVLATQAEGGRSSTTGCTNCASSRSSS